MAEKDVPHATADGALSISEASIGAAWWTPLWSFAIHVFVGTGLFLTIFAPAVGLHFLVAAMERIELGRVLTAVAYGAEYLLLFVDVVLFMAVILRSTWKALRELWAPTGK
jgi:hypothetical protein